jgi:hypothetical protein
MLRKVVLLVLTGIKALQTCKWFQTPTPITLAAQVVLGASGTSFVRMVHGHGQSIDINRYSSLTLFRYFILCSCLVTGNRTCPSRYLQDEKSGKCCSDANTSKSDLHDKSFMGRYSTKVIKLAVERWSSTIMLRPHLYYIGWYNFYHRLWLLGWHCVSAKGPIKHSYLEVIRHRF